MEEAVQTGELVIANSDRLMGRGGEPAGARSGRGVGAAWFWFWFWPGSERACVTALMMILAISSRPLTAPAARACLPPLWRQRPIAPIRSRTIHMARPRPSQRLLNEAPLCRPATHTHPLLQSPSPDLLLGRIDGPYLPPGDSPHCL